jgi:hypothetical protein
MNKKEAIIKYNSLKSQPEKRKFVLSIIKDPKYIRCLEFEQIAQSTIDFAFKTHFGIPIVWKENYYTNLKR